METIQMIQKATAFYGQVVVGSFITTTCPFMHHVLCRILVQSFGETLITHVTQSLYSPGLVLCDLWLFPKLKSPLKGCLLYTSDAADELCGV